MRFLLPIVLCLVLPSAVLAGAWPREEGRVFLSLGHNLRSDTQAMAGGVFDPDGYTTLYLEYGVTPRLTFGLDAGRGESGDHSAIAFLRYPLPFWTEGPAVAAWQAGLGHTRHGNVTEPLLQLGASLGRGLETAHGPGWLSLDLQVQSRIDTGGRIAKADATFGISPDERTKLYVQLQAGDYPGSKPGLRLAGAVVRRIAPGAWVEIGADAGLLGDGTVGLTLGTWLEF